MVFAGYAEASTDVAELHRRLEDHIFEHGTLSFLYDLQNFVETITQVLTRITSLDVFSSSTSVFMRCDRVGAQAERYETFCNGHVVEFGS